MCVVLHRKSEVSFRRIAGSLQNIFSWPHQLDHGQRQVREVIGVGGFAFHQKVVERLGIGRRGQLFALLRGQAYDAIPVRGCSHDAAQRRNFFQQPRNYAVGGDHEVLDQFSRPILLHFLDVDNLPVRKQRNNFIRIEVKRAIREAQLLERLGNLILQFKLCLQIGRRGHFRRSGRCAVQPCSNGVIGQLRLVTNDRPIHIAGTQRAASVDREFHDHGRPVHVG